jgi:hypothetical protein
MSLFMETPGDSALEARFRLMLCVLAITTFVITPAELILLGHTHSAIQWVPFVASFFGLVACGWVLADPGPTRIRAARLLSGPIILSGFLGAFMHLRANLLLEMEIRPNSPLVEAIGPALQGSAAFLAPGILILGALLVMGATYRHPASS